MNAPQQPPPKREGFVEVPPAAAPINMRQSSDGSIAGEVETTPATNGQASTPVPAGPVPDHWPVVVRLLKKPITDNRGVLVRELAFREPTGGDINRVGNPVRVDLNGEIIIDDQKMMKMIAALSGILQPFIEHMDPRDYASCAYRLRGFFLPDPEAW